MVWHGMYVGLYKRNPDMAEELDSYAMLFFAVIVILVHIMQTCWFFVGKLFLMYIIGKFYKNFILI